MCTTSYLLYRCGHGVCLETERCKYWREEDSFCLRGKTKRWIRFDQRCESCLDEAQPSSRERRGLDEGSGGARGEGGRAKGGDAGDCGS